MNFSNKYIIIIILFSVIFLASFSVQAESELLTVTGRAYIEDNDLESAYQSALNNALRTALEQAVGVYINAETRTENFELIEDNILTRTQGYIKSYDIIDEYLEDDNYFLKLEAKVSSEDLIDDLEALELNIKRFGNPRLAVVVDNSLVATELQSELLAAGYLVVEPQKIEENLASEQKEAIIEGDYDLADEIANRLSADILISGTVETDFVDLGEQFSDGFGSGLISAYGDINLKMINAATAEIVAVANSDAREVGISEQSASRDALLTASNEIADSMLEELTQNLISDDRTVSLKINDLTITDKINQLETALAESSDVLMAYFREYGGSSLSFDLDVKSETRLLSLAADLEELTDFNLEVDTITENRLVLSIGQD